MSEWPAFELRLPAWIGEAVGDSPRPGPDARMDLVLELAHRNVAEGTGGPFAAAVFQSSTGRLVAPGVNLVVPSSAAVAHAEVVAIALAGRTLGSFDLGPDSELVTSTEPCTMCFGACLWSGVGRLVTGATTEDAERIGFDEGPKPVDWVGELERRGIEVVTGVRRAEAVAVLTRYAAAGGPIYNGRGGSHA